VALLQETGKSVQNFTEKSAWLEETFSTESSMLIGWRVLGQLRGSYK
jgi:hypothetical protein